MIWVMRRRKRCRRRAAADEWSRRSAPHDQDSIASFCRHSCDRHVKRARGFYEGVLGLGVAEEMMGGQWVEYDLGNNTLAIANVGPQWAPSDQGTGAALEVDDFEGAVSG